MPRERPAFWRATRSTVLVALAAVVVGAPTWAFGYVRTKTCDPGGGIYNCEAGEEAKAISWPVRCVKFRINREGSSQFESNSDGAIGATLREAVVDSFDSWNQPGCSDFQLVEGPLTSNDDSEFLQDEGYAGNMNLIVWRDDDWPHADRSTVFALTRVRFDGENGRIQDADVEINTATYDFDILEESRAGEADAPIDLKNSLTHEAGHLLGLAHTDVESATMYGMASPGEIKKRELHRDDIDGLCAIYPAKEPPATCQEPGDFVPEGARDDEDGSNPDPCGCATEEGGPVGGTYVFVFFAAWFLRRRALAS